MNKMMCFPFTPSLVLMMKRALPSYDDLSKDFAESVEEEGEIIENDSFLKCSEEAADEDAEDFGLKSVLPVGKFDATFKVGDVPSTGEQYLCTVRFQTKRLPKVERSEDSLKTCRPISVDKLIGFEGKAQVELKEAWSETYWKAYLESEARFQSQMLESVSDNDCLLSDNDCLLSGFIKGSSWKAFWWRRLYGQENEILKPSMQTLTDFRAQQDLVLKLLNLHGQWLQVGDELHSKVLVDGPVLDLTATWLHALLMCLDSALTSPEISVLRDLVVVLACEAFKNLTEFHEVILVICKKYKQSDLIKYTTT
jgi:hypothetical protein